MRDRDNGQAHPLKRVNCRGMRKTKVRIGQTGAQARALTWCVKIDQHAFTSWQTWGSSGLQALSFPSLPPEPLHLRYLNMSFAGARHFVASNNIFNEAQTVSEKFILKQADGNGCLADQHQLWQDDVRWGHSPYAKSKQSVHRPHTNHHQTQDALFQHK